eukprot:CAMPEP_0178936166 /NCGR_PEP_ID=MMETSP0786-20121207/25017_1 /TAXON_ID=186022 /ORGANISM="Thalassionema frauenfeldii, Strain CCMP 1798" /LENGTH=160 /DNA_ID=CAMNT_0020614529 /DNA_START=341 /DNA_END=823 /DNA_ORIENTATION=-
MVNRMRQTTRVLQAAKRECFKESRAAVILQLFYQKEVKGFIINRHATKIQSFFRMVRSMVDLELLKDKERRRLRKERKRARKMQKADAMSVFSSQQGVLSNYCKQQATRSASRTTEQENGSAKNTSPSLTPSDKEGMKSTKKASLPMNERRLAVHLRFTT